MYGKLVQEKDKNKHSIIRSQQSIYANTFTLSTYPPLFRNSILFHKAIKRLYNDIPKYIAAYQCTLCVIFESCFKALFSF